jgi:hypothetical protein
MTALSALPETIAKSVKEAIGTPQQPTPPVQKTEETAPPKKTEETAPPKKDEGTPGKKTFAQMWFS